jgi:hypothetical protein
LGRAPVGTQAPVSRGSALPADARFNLRLLNPGAYGRRRNLHIRQLGRDSEERELAIDAAQVTELALTIMAMANGMAMEKLVDPDRVADDLYGWSLVVLFKGLAAEQDALAR